MSEIDPNWLSRTILGRETIEALIAVRPPRPDGR
jgi:hypothetical protein